MRRGFIPVSIDVKKPRNKGILRSSSGRGGNQKSTSKFGCEVCPLKGRRIVEGDGDKKTANVVIVGDAPGKTEDELGIPFVGKSGRLLRELIKHAQLENVYITNVVKCRPDRNETPTPLMIKCCKSKLEDELRQVVGKKLIVACGDTATDWLTKQGEVIQNRGFFYDTEYGKVMITLHPAYVVRNLGVTDVLGNDALDYFSQDIRRVNVFLDTGKVCKDITEKIYVVKTSEDIQHMLDVFLSFSQTGGICGVDFETSILDMFSPQMAVLSVAITQGKEKVWCVPFKFLDPVLKEFASQTVQKVLDINNLVMHNANFDMLVAHTKFGCELKQVDDTMIMYYLLDGNRGHSSKKLKRLAMDWTDYGDYGVEYDVLLKLPEAELVDYNCKDALATVELRDMFLDKMRSVWGNSMLEGYENVVKPSQLVLFWATVNGMKVNVEYGVKLLAELQDKITAVEQRTKIVTGRDLKLGSPKQMLLYLREQGVNITSTGVEILEQYKGKHVVIDLLLEHRQLSKLCNTYVKPILENHLREGNLIHGKFNLTGTATGRIASSDPNMQNVPVRVGPMIEMMFISRFESGYIVKADYCLDGDTLLETIGKKLSIRNVVDKVNTGEKVYIYCWNGERIAVSEVTAGKKTGVDKEVWKVTVDNGKSVVATPEHSFMLRNGVYKKLKELLPGDSLMPFYSKINDYGYGKYRSISLNNGKTVLEHNLIVKDVFGVEITGSNKVVHHKNGNGLCNSLKNLEVMDRRKHMSIHGKQRWQNNLRKDKIHWTQTPEGRKRCAEGAKKQWENYTEFERQLIGKKISENRRDMHGPNNPRYGKEVTVETRRKQSVAMRRKPKRGCAWNSGLTKDTDPRVAKISQTIKSGFINGRVVHNKGKKGVQIPWNKGLTKETEPRLKVLGERISGTKKLNQQKRILNHIVVKVEFFGHRDVYNITVDKYHNFALESGVIVKNSQMELRVAAVESNDKKMIEFFKTGKDIHNMVATDIYGVSESEMLSGSQRAKEARRVAKGFNFGVLYGRGAYSIAQELNIRTSEAEEKKRQYFELFPQLKRWLDRTQTQALKDKYVRNMFGRVRYIAGLYSTDETIRDTALREAVNTPIQGAASDIALLGVWRCYQEIRKRGLKTKLVNFIHDAVLFDTPNNELEEVISIIKEKAVQLPPFVKTAVPLAIDIAWGRTWGDCA